MQMNTNSNKKANNRSLRTISEAGLRITNQRALIMDIIRREKGHPDADEVYRLAREKQPHISLSTVYRTLQTLKGLGLVEEVHFDETHHHYETKPAGEHCHLLCLGCGKIIEFKYPLALMVKVNVPDAKDFDIVGSEVRLTGYCANCRKNRK